MTNIAEPFYHGTKSALEIGDEFVPGYGCNFQVGRASNNIYFTAVVETAAWGAELAAALAGSDERGHIYVVEPLGPLMLERLALLRGQGLDVIED